MYKKRHNIVLETDPQNTVVKENSMHFAIDI